MAVVGVFRRTGHLWRLSRRRYGWLDHLARAARRYLDQQADHLAAGLAYYAFFAAFALTGLGFAILGFVLRRDAGATALVERWVQQNVPWLDASVLADVGPRIGLLALAALAVAGLAWVRGIRSAVRTVWKLEAEPGQFLVRAAVDLAVLVGLGVLLSLSIAITVGASAGVRWLLADAGIGDTRTDLLLAGVGVLLALAVNTLMATALLTGLPRIAMPPRRVLGPALFVAIGLELLKTLGRLYLERSVANPAYQAVASAVGLLLFLYLLNQILLFAAALTATSRQGTAVDLTSGTPVPAAGAVPDDVVTPAAGPSGPAAGIGAPAAPARPTGVGALDNPNAPAGGRGSAAAGGRGNASTGSSAEAPAGGRDARVATGDAGDNPTDPRSTPVGPAS